jgi:hypothetical protein
MFWISLEKGCVHIPEGIHASFEVLVLYMSIISVPFRKQQHGYTDLAGAQ